MTTPGRIPEARAAPLEVLCRKCGGDGPRMVGAYVMLVKRLRAELARVRKERDEAQTEAWAANLRNLSQAREINRLRERRAG